MDLGLLYWQGGGYNVVLSVVFAAVVVGIVKVLCGWGPPRRRPAGGCFGADCRTRTARYGSAKEKLESFAGSSPSGCTGARASFLARLFWIFLGGSAVVLGMRGFDTDFECAAFKGGGGRCGRRPHIKIP